MFVGDIQVYTARTVAEALKLKAENPTASFLAGGTDIMVYLDQGVFKNRLLINIWGIEELREIREDDDTVKIGALATYTDLLKSPLIGQFAPSLREAARSVGALQIQNRGTIGGNIGNASPAGDTLPVLLSLDARVVVASESGGERTIDFSELFVGYRKLALRDDEMILWVEIPKFSGENVYYFRKVGTRQAQSISKVSFAGRLQLGESGVVEARLAFGAVAPIPIRCRRTEELLVERGVEPEAASVVAEEISPIDDIRSSAEYRKLVAVRILRSWLEYLKENLG